MGSELKKILIERCVADDEFNTRKRGLGDITDLVASISAIGVQQPLLGKAKENKAGEVEIYAGFRRLAAATEAGLKEVPVLISKRRGVTRKQMLVTNVTENLQREDLNPIDEGFAMQRLQTEHQMSTDEICAQLGVKKSRVENRFRLLKLKDIVRDGVHDGRITIKAAFEIERLPVDKQDKYVEIAEELSGNKLSALIDKELEKIQKKIQGTDKKPPPDPAAVTEHFKLIKKTSSVLCAGLGYDEAATKEVKGISFRPMDPDNVTVLAKFFDDLAETVEDEVAFNEKAQEEIVSLVESSGEAGKKMYDTEGPVFRAALIRAIGERAEELAKERAEASGKRPKVTFALAKEVLEEFFCPYTEEVSDDTVVPITGANL